jgi:hypothetical protein
MKMQEMIDLLVSLTDGEFKNMKRAMLIAEVKRDGFCNFAVHLLASKIDDIKVDRRRKAVQKRLKEENDYSCYDGDVK